jgi:hypothetical protein
MVGRFGDRQTRDGNRMASSGLSTVLALALPGTRRSAEGERRDSNSHPPDSFRKFRLGSAEDPRELLKLGFEVSERTVARYLRRLRPRRGDPAQRWLAFLANHREAIVAFDLHRTDVDVQPAVLLFRDRACEAQSPALQRHSSSNL